MTPALALAAVLLTAAPPHPAPLMECVEGAHAFRRGAFDEVVERHTACLEFGDVADTVKVAALDQRAYAHYRLGWRDRAVSDLRAALELQPPTTLAGAERLRNLGFYLREAGRPEESLLVLERAYALAERSTQRQPSISFHYELGRTLQALHRDREAIEIYTKGIPERPDDESVYLQRAQAYEAVGDAANARRDYVRFWELRRRESGRLSRWESDKLRQYDIIPAR